jgi:hypothetical protein
MGLFGDYIGTTMAGNQGLFLINVAIYQGYYIINMVANQL